MIRSPRAETSLRYVTHACVLDYLMCGWHILVPDLGGRHVEWSVMMAWLCDCKLVEPNRCR
jgi:hypothetical protein